jgi:hypothetical protein
MHGQALAFGSLLSLARHLGLSFFTSLRALSHHPNKNDCSCAAFRTNRTWIAVSKLASFPQSSHSSESSQTGNSGCIYATHQVLTSSHPSTRTTSIILDEAENMVESKGSVNLIIWRVSETILKGSQREHFTDMHMQVIFTN